MAQLLPGWKLTFRQVSWRDPTAGLASAEVDVAIAWLPVPETGLLSWQVVATEDRWVALPANHRLAWKSAVTLEDLAGRAVHRAACHRGTAPAVLAGGR